MSFLQAHVNTFTRTLTFSIVSLEIQPGCRHFLRHRFGKTHQKCRVNTRRLFRSRIIPRFGCLFCSDWLAFLAPIAHLTFTMLDCTSHLCSIHSLNYGIFLSVMVKLCPKKVVKHTGSLTENAVPVYIFVLSHTKTRFLLQNLL